MNTPPPLERHGKATGSTLWVYYPNGEGWPLEQCSYWLDGAVRLAYILNDTALISKVTKRLDTVVSGVLDGGESFIYWRPKSVLDESVGSPPRAGSIRQLGSLSHGARPGGLL